MIQADRRHILICLVLALSAISAGCAPSSQATLEPGPDPTVESSMPVPAIELDPQSIWQTGSGQAHTAVLDDSGNYLAVGSSSGLYLYDAANGRLVQSLSRGESVFTLDFSPDSRFLAYVPLNSNHVELWDLVAQRFVHTFPAPDAPIRHLAFSPAGDIVAAGSFEAMNLWRLDDGELIRQITPEQGARIRDLSFSPDGSLISASLIREGPDLAAFWFTADGSSSGTFGPGEDLWLANAQLSADSRWLAVEYGAGNGSTAAPAGLLLHALGPPSPARMLQRESVLVPDAWTFSAEGRWLAAGYRDGTIGIWSMMPDQPVTVLPAPGEARLVMLEADGGGEGITAVYDDGQIRHISLPDGDIIYESQTAHSQQLVELSGARQGDLLLNLEDNGRLQLYDVQTGLLKTTIEQHTDGPISSLAFSPDGRVLVAGMANGQVKLMETETGEQTAVLPDHQGRVDGLAFSPDGRTLASGVGERVSSLAFDDTVRLWSWPEQKLVQELGGDQEEVAGCSSFQNQVAYAPDGELLAAASHDFTVQLWRMADGEIQHVLSGHEAPILDLSMAPDGTAAASASEDGTIRIWSLVSGEPIHILRSPAFGWQAVSYAPDGQRLAGATASGEIILWDVRSGRQLNQISAGLNPRSDLVFSADGSYLAGAVGTDVRLWHADSGEQGEILTGRGGTINSLAFSADGRWFAAGSQQGTITLWRLYD